MYNLGKLCCLAFTFLATSQFALASTDNDPDPVNIVVGLAYKSVNETFQVGPKKFKPSFVTLDWTLTTAYKNYFISFDYDLSIKDNFSIDNTLDGSGEIENNPILFSREDSSLTFGYSFESNFSVFGGYKYGKTKAITFANLINFNSQAFPPADTFGNGESSLFIDNSSFSFKEEGPFIGGSYRFRLSDSGSINFSLAFASMDGEVLFNNVVLREGSTVGATTGTRTVFVSEKTTGDTSGLSFAIIWSDQLSESSNFSIKLQSVKYEFDADPTPGDDLSSDVDFLIFSIGLVKFF